MKKQIDNKIIAKRIKDVMQISDYTIENLANKCSIQPNTLRSILSGNNTPSLELLCRISTYTGAPIDYFLVDYMDNKSIAINYMLAMLFDKQDSKRNTQILHFIQELYLLKNNLK